MIDFNEMVMFAKVIECGGFLSASKKFGIPKSTLSRKISNLEKRLNVRLIQRSTRRLMITDIGREYYQYCLQMMIAAEKAENSIINQSEKTVGTVKLTCSNILMDLGLAGVLTNFMRQYPRVNLHVKIFNREVDIISEGYDLSLKLLTEDPKNSSLVMRKICHVPTALMINPAENINYQEINVPEDLANVPTVGWLSAYLQAAWTFQRADHEVKINSDSRMICDDIRLIKEAIIKGIGVGCLPLRLAHQELSDGRLITILDDWTLEQPEIVAFYPSRQGLPPAVRALIDFIVEELAD